MMKPEDKPTYAELEKQCNVVGGRIVEMQDDYSPFMLKLKSYEAKSESFKELGNTADLIEFEDFVVQEIEVVKGIAEYDTCKEIFMELACKNEVQTADISDFREVVGPGGHRTIEVS